MNINAEYKATINYMFRQLPMYQREGNVAFKKDLTNIKLLCEVLADPQDRFPSIHIAGTNGKGSTAHMLSAMLQAKGYKVGLYTSPHYRDFRERIKVNGKYISKAFVVDFVQQNDQAFQKIKPSFFEITVAMAFDYFAQQKVDYAIIETGLGGRLDSTNIIQPLLSVITNISLDHQHMLGNTLALIAKEKAGIIKNKIPVIIGEKQAETKAVFEATAKRKKAPLIFASDELEAKLVREDDHHSYYDLSQHQELLLKDLKVNLHGPYQGKNLCTAISAIMRFDTLQEKTAMDLEAIRSGLVDLKKRTNYIGRWQILKDHPKIIADSAHNESGLAIAMQKLQSMDYEQLHIVMGMVNDKTISKLLQFFPKKAQYYFAKANIPRGLAADILQSQAAEFGLQGRSYSSVKNALRAAKRHAGSKDFIYVGGSSFVVAEVI